MTRALCAVLLAATATGAWAAPADVARVDVPKLEVALRAARFRRNLGWGLSLTGIAMVCAGAVAMISASSQSFDQGIVDGVAGAVTALVGLVVAIPGVVLALRGQDAMTDLEWRIRVATPVVAPLAGGALIGARFTF